MLRIALTWSLYGLACIGLVFWAYIAYRVGWYPENHVGWNPLWSLALFSALALLALWHWIWNSEHLAPWILGVALVSCLVVLALDHFNILVPYEAWLKRGMPERPF